MMFGILKIKNNKAFTAIELMIVVAIIGILLSIAVMNFNELQKNLKKKACLANMGTIHNAVRLYFMENPTVSDQFDLSMKDLMDGKYIPTEPRCPNAVNLTKSSAFYSIIDKPGKKVDVVCVNIHDSASAHGSYLKIIDSINGVKPKE